MADRDLFNLLAMAAQRRDDARREMEAWDDFIRRLQMLGGKDVAAPALMSSNLGALGRLGAGGALSAHLPHVNAPPIRRSIDPAVQQTVAATKAFLAKLGRPAGIAEIYAEMQRLEIPVGGKDPKRTLDARLRYSRAFTGVPGKGWWLAEQQTTDSNTAAPAQSEDAAAEESDVEPNHNPMAVS